MIEYGHKIKGEIKAIQTEIQKNIQGTNSEGKGTGTQINSVDQKEKETSNQNRMKKQEFKTIRKGLGTSRTSLNFPTS